MNRVETHDCTASNLLTPDQLGVMEAQADALIREALADDCRAVEIVPLSRRALKRVGLPPRPSDRNQVSPYLVDRNLRRLYRRGPVDSPMVAACFRAAGIRPPRASSDVGG